MQKEKEPERCPGLGGRGGHPPRPCGATFWPRQEPKPVTCLAFQNASLGRRGAGFANSRATLFRKGLVFWLVLRGGQAANAWEKGAGACASRPGHVLALVTEPT